MEITSPVLCADVAGVIRAQLVFLQVIRGHKIPALMIERQGRASVRAGLDCVSVDADDRRGRVASAGFLRLFAGHQRHVGGGFGRRAAAKRGQRALHVQRHLLTGFDLQLAALREAGSFQTGNILPELCGHAADVLAGRRLGIGVCKHNDLIIWMQLDRL